MRTERSETKTEESAQSQASQCCELLVCYRGLHVVKKAELADAYIKQLGTMKKRCACPMCGCRTFMTAH